jgi:hypothetical protein
MENRKKMKDMKIKPGLGALLSLLIFISAGCASFRAPFGPPEAFLFTSVKAPLTTNFDKTPNDPNMLKVSRRKTYWFNIPYIGIDFAWGDVGIQRIAEEGGIHEIAYVDYEFFSLLNFPVFSASLYKSFTINVYGYGAK